MRRKLATVVIIAALVAGCEARPESMKNFPPPSSAERGRLELLMQVNEQSKFKLGYRMGHMDTLQFYLDHKRFPSSADLNADDAWVRMNKELKEIK